MSELDPLCGYQESGQPAPTYAHYNRMKKSTIGARNCKLAIAGLVLILIALVVAVVLLFIYDKPVSDVPDREPDTGNLLRMAQGDKLYSRLREDEASSEAFDNEALPGHPGHPLVVSPRREKVRYGEDPSLYNQFSRFNKEFGQSRHEDSRSSPSSPDWKNNKASLASNDAVLIRDCLKKGWDEVARRKELEKTLTPPEGPAFYQQMATALIPEAADEIDKAVATEAALKCLKEQNVDLERLKFNNPSWSGLKNELPQCREEPVSCNPKYKYRSLEGTCNNLRHPKWGSKLQTFRRLLPADYVDGLSEPKPSFPKGIYPPPRQVSICMQNATNKYSEFRLNLLFAHFAHFLDHDMTSIAAYKGENRSAIPCCEDNRHPECYSLELKDNDPFYRDVGLMCMDFVRSAPAPVCNIGPREHMNQQTAYIDMSNVYSVNQFEGRKILRDIAGGYLRSPTEADGRYMLLRNMDPNDGCNDPENLAANTPCFKSGDPRVNTFIGLTAMTQAWMREHNRVTDFLIKINPHWDDERLYQESRRIVVAELQHIVYNEFLPLLFGEKMTKELNIRPLKKGYYYGYDDNINAGVSNSFAAAAFRFYHSMYRGHVGFNDPEGSTGYSEKEGTWYYVLTHTMLFKPNILWNFGTVDALWRGAAATHSRPMHNSFAHDNANHLFQTGNDTYGFDIFAFDIQRGRDHGIPPYYKWREYCNLPPASNFTEMAEFFRPHSLEVIQRFYVDGTHLDLFTGMLAENPIEDGILGPVSACIIADQFVRAKNGDRFWYETPDPLLRFTPAQLETIRNITLARVLCENGDNLDMIPGRALEGISETNPLLHCSGYQIHRLDLTRWDEPEPASWKKH